MNYLRYLIKLANYGVALDLNLQKNNNESTLTTFLITSDLSLRSPSTGYLLTHPFEPYLAYSPQLFFSKERVEILHNLVQNRSGHTAHHNNQRLIEEFLVTHLPFKSYSENVTKTNSTF